MRMRPSSDSGSSAASTAPPAASTSTRISPRIAWPETICACIATSCSPSAPRPCRSEGPPMKHETPPDDAIRIEDRWYVLATSTRAGEPNRVLKHGESFVLLDRHGDMPRAGSGEHGLYHQGTRFLS